MTFLQCCYTSGETEDSREEEAIQWRQVIPLHTRILRTLADTPYLQEVLNENVAYKRGGARRKNGGPGNNNGENHHLCTGYVYAVHWTCISTGKRADIHCTLHYTATCTTCVIACPDRDIVAWRFYHRNERVETSSSEMKSGDSNFLYSTVICDLFM